MNIRYPIYEGVYRILTYLRGFDGDEISLELDLHIGRELEIGGPVIIPDWEDTPETEFP